MKVALTSLLTLTTGALLAFPASANSGAGSPGIQTPACVGDYCNHSKFNRLPGGRYAHALDATVSRLISRGYRALEAEKPEKAMRSMLMALERRPDHALVRFHAGVSSYVAGDLTGARELLVSSLTTAKYGQLSERQRASALIVIDRIDKATSQTG